MSNIPVAVIRKVAQTVTQHSALGTPFTFTDYQKCSRGFRSLGFEGTRPQFDNLSSGLQECGIVFSPLFDNWNEGYWVEATLKAIKEGKVPVECINHKDNPHFSRLVQYIIDNAEKSQQVSRAKIRALIVEKLYKDKRSKTPKGGIDRVIAAACNKRPGLVKISDDKFQYTEQNGQSAPTQTRFPDEVDIVVGKRHVIGTAVEMRLEDDPKQGLVAIIMVVVDRFRQLTKSE